jgi:hypothetical protein
LHTCDAACGAAERGVSCCYHQGRVDGARPGGNRTQHAHAPRAHPHRTHARTHAQQTKQTHL